MGNEVENITIDRNAIKNIIQNILNVSHKTPQKKVIKESEKGLQFADPIGGDSKKNPYEKRCHLYWNTFYVISYDDEGYKMSFTNFIKKFGMDIDPKQKVAIINHIDNNISYSDYENEFIDSKLDDLIELDNFCQKINENSESNIQNIEPVKMGSKVHIYLKNRAIYDYKNIYQAIYKKTDTWKEPVIVILNKKNDHLIGMQIRNLKSDYKRLYKIYNYKQTLELLGIEDIDNKYDLNEIVMYNKLSYFYNIFNVNYYRPITIFEGYLDSIFFPNSIGVAGVNTDFRFLENNELNIRYLFDNDPVGHKKAEEKLNAGYKVFLWEKLFDWIVENKKPSDPYKFRNRISKIKDLNFLATIVKDPYKKLNLENFFSKSMFDKKYLKY